MFCCCIRRTDPEAYELRVRPSTYTMRRTPAWSDAEPGCAPLDPLYCQLLTGQAYDEMMVDPLGELSGVIAIQMDDEDDPRRSRAETTISLYQPFALAQRLLGKFHLPVTFVAKVSSNSITGYEAVAIGTRAPVNWLNFMITSPDTMNEFFRYGDLKFVKPSLTAVICARQYPSTLVPPAPPTDLTGISHTPVPGTPRQSMATRKLPPTPRSVPRTQLRVPRPRSMHSPPPLPDPAVLSGPSRDPRFASRPFFYDPAESDSGDEERKYHVIAAEVEVSSSDLEDKGTMTCEDF